MDFNVSTFAGTALWEWWQVMHNQRVKHRQKEDAENQSFISVRNAITIFIISLYQKGLTVLGGSHLHLEAFWDIWEITICANGTVSYKTNMKNLGLLSSLRHLGRGTERRNNFPKDIVADLDTEPTDLNHSPGPELKRFPPSVIRQEFNKKRQSRKLCVGSVAKIRHWWV